MDLSRNFFDIELALNGDNVVEAMRLCPTNNFAHTLLKQISVRLSGTLISPQTDTYHYKVYLETLLVAGRLIHENVKVRMYLCQVRLNPSVYRELMTNMNVNRTVVAYLTLK